ncbi:hypothetical protein BD779DRAFT_1609955 [Infundibulicybe gibba]|nr:hypothetical protein BD779DRAFT_1609955 [Infundibulicybe gibba]
MPEYGTHPNKGQEIILDGYDRGATIKAPTRETRRMRGEIACAECRRLKIRCDRSIPCSSCIKRGCVALCPNGIIPPGEGSRFVLAATEHLHQKIMYLEARMHSLEDAIAIVETSRPGDRPRAVVPRLADLEKDRETGDALGNTTELVEHLGTLCIDDRGGSRFFGPSGGSEASSNNARPPLQELDPSYLPPEISICSQAFPFSPVGVQPMLVQPMIEAYLPPIRRAITLCETFLEHLSWMFHIVSRQQMVNELIPAIYKNIRTSYGPHDLALMLIVLGIGTLVDLDLPPYSLEAQHYYQLSRAALALQPVLGEQSMVTIKVLHLMSIYNGMSGKETNLEQSYNLLDFAGQVALRVNIDPSMWGLHGKEAYDRRVYFWNLMAAVLWQSLVTGRPPCLLTSFIDCRIPSTQDEQLFQRGEVPLGFGIWGFRASLECLIPVVKTTLAVKPPKYEDILNLDRKIRDFALPQPDNPLDERTATSMRIFVRSHYQDLMLLFLHRGFFAQAMVEAPTNPLGTEYAPSIRAAYSSACVVLRDTTVQFSKKPLLCARIWRIWSFAFSAAVVVGTVAIRGLALRLEPSALHEFQSACTTFRQAARTNSRAARAMVYTCIDLNIQAELTDVVW